MVEEAVRSRAARDGSARVLPSGTVTFVFTDIAGSTKLVHDLGTQRFEDILKDHARMIRSSVASNSGYEVRTQGDSFFLAFPTARGAVAAAADAQRALQSHSWPHGAEISVRMGMHSGEATPASSDAGTDHVGYAVHHAARIAGAGHGGQVLLSSATRSLLEEALPDGLTLLDLGEHRLKDMSEADRIYQLCVDGCGAPRR